MVLAIFGFLQMSFADILDILLLGLMIFAIVFWIGRYLINTQESPYFRG